MLSSTLTLSTSNERHGQDSLTSVRRSRVCESANPPLYEPEFRRQEAQDHPTPGGPH